MSKSKSVGILLLLALGLTFAVNSSAETKISVSKKNSKKASVKAKKTVKKAPRANSISNSENTLKAPIEKIKPVSVPTKKWALDTHVDYTPETSKAFDSGILYGLDYFYRPSAYHSFGILKRADQVLLPSTTIEKFVVGNTRLYYKYQFTNTEIKDHSVAMRFLVTVGDSEQAKLDGLNSAQSARLEFHLINGGFVLGLRPYLSYYWADYGTNAKGDPMPLFGVGHNLLLAYSFNDKWSIGSEINTAFSFLQPEEMKRAKAFAEAQGQDASKVVDTTTSSFNAGVELGYQATKAFAMRLGYAQEDKLVTEGKYGVEFLDKKSTRGYVGLDYSF